MQKLPDVNTYQISVISSIPFVIHLNYKHKTKCKQSNTGLACLFSKSWRITFNDPCIYRAFTNTATIPSKDGSQVLPFLWRTVQSGQRSCSWFQAKSQVFPGVTPQLLHRMQVMHTCINTTMSVKQQTDNCCYPLRGITANKTHYQ